MAISLKTQKLLWGKAAGRCSRPECRRTLVEDATQTDDPTLIGENCHIIAEADDGPRGDPTVSTDQRNKYENLILLCNADHKVVDDQTGKYTVDVLRQMKTDHEKWVEIQLGVDHKKQHDDLVYADYVDTWIKLTHLDQWTAWSSWILSSGQPRQSREIDDDLRTLRNWLLRRIWPGRYTAIESAFRNFFIVLQDFQEKFREHAIPSNDGEMLRTEKFYKIDRWDDEAYATLSREYSWHVDIVGDLMLELTRAAQLVCDRIRENMAPSFRLAEGRLIVQSGPDFNFGFHDFVVQYSQQEREMDAPYPGFQQFLTIRTQRDIHYGSTEKP